MFEISINNLTYIIYINLNSSFLTKIFDFHKAFGFIEIKSVRIKMSMYLISTKIFESDLNQHFTYFSRLQTL